MARRKASRASANDDRFYGSLNFDGNDRPDVRVDNTGYIAGGKRHEAISRALLSSPRAKLLRDAR